MTGGVGGSEAMHWVGTWATSPQLTEQNNLPPQPGLANNTLRQIVYVSIGGSTLRVQFSNAFGTSPVTINAAHIALATSGSGIDPSTDVALTFDGEPSVTIPAGEEVFSDPFEFALMAQTKVAVTTHFGEMSNTVVTGHPGSRTTSYLQAGGDALSAESMPSAAMTDHWYILTGIDVMAPTTSRAVVILGDSITDGRGSTTNGNDRWPDALSRRLRENSPTAGVAVLNMGVGGNAVLSGGLGPTALARFDRDVLEQRGVRWVIVLEGVNDLGAANSEQVADQLIAAYQQFIDKAHGKDLLIYGVPILPFGKNTDYYNATREAARQKVNEWIRTSGEFDAVIDLDEAVRDPMNPQNLREDLDFQDDGLHLNPTGLQLMADSIDLSLFTE